MVKRRGEFVIIVFVIILLFSIFSNADEEEIFSGTVESGVPINVSGDFYSFSISSDNSRISSTLPDGLGLIVVNGTCESRGNYIVCFSGSEY
ncbi:MAG: hypothetical protein QF824_04140 [Candidatus Woesearchaeota archaeon]|jgi:hypothetical protein|nr:hypothetical protein [Candidatus Woesearchaeota archaeon]